MSTVSRDLRWRPVKNPGENRETSARCSSNHTAESCIESLEENDQLKPDEIIKVAEEALRLAERGDQKVLKKKALLHMAKAYSELRDYQQSIYCLRTILQESGMDLTEEEKADCHDRLGTAYWNICDYDGALENLISALDYYERIADETRKSPLESNIGIVFAEIGEDEKAVEYTRKALQTAEITNDNARRAYSLNNLGILLFRQDRRKEALECFLESAAIKEQLGEEAKLVTTYLNIADAYAEFGDREKVVPYIEKALRIAVENDDTRYHARALKALGSYYLGECCYDRAESFLKKALAMSQQISNAKDTVDVLAKLSDLYEKKEDHSSALQYKKEQMELQKKIFSEETARRVAEAHTLYEVKKKELEAELLKERTEELARLNRELNSQFRDLQATESALREANMELQVKMEIDPLTGLLNNQRIYEKLQGYIGQSRANDETLSVIMFDLDHFKELNDRFGHPVGNRALEEIGRVIRENVRENDLAFRFGGEEFLVVLPCRGIDVAINVAERIRKAVEKMTFHEDARITVSGGVEELDQQGAHELIVDVDRLLYEAKNSGRNRIAY